MSSFPIYLQYANSPKLKDLVNKTANSLLFKDIDFVTDYLDIKTASTAGLNNWGIILNQPRNVISGTIYDGVFGFDTGVIPTNTTDYPQNFYNSNFFNINYTPTIDLDNNEYRALLLMIYRSKITNNSIYIMNDIIKEYAINTGGSGIPVVYSNYDMSITYDFNYILQTYERYLFNNPNTGATVLPKPAGVSIVFIY